MSIERLPRDLAANRLTTALERRKREGRPYIDLTLSNPTIAGFSYPDDLLAPLADRRSLVYRPEPSGVIDARAAVSNDYARQGVEVAPDRILLTASTSEAYSLLFKLLTGAGDEVLVPRPSYPLFDHLTRLDLVAAVPYDLEYHGRWSIDMGSVERAITPRTRAVLIVSPNNPTGSYIGGEELDRLALVCAAKDLAIIADEVFVDYELESGARTAAGRASRRHDVLSFALGGLSKSVGLPQVKLGWIAAAGPEDRVARALARLELICDTYLSVSTPAQVAAPELLRRGAIVRDQIAARVRRNYDTLKSLAPMAPACRVLRSDGGWYAVLHVPSFEPEEELALRLLDAGVLAHPGFFFDFHRESFLIVSLLTPAASFDDGITRILRHFACTDLPGSHV
jgi:aspartate/methionine/tyrosine aminotransferase